MNTDTNSIRLAQSASALGAGLLGFGLGAKWGVKLGEVALIIIIVGAIIHIGGMYAIQLRNRPEKFSIVAKILWVSAWLCLIAVIALFIYMVFF